MYLHLELKTMATERLAEALARLHYLHTLMAATPGFVNAQICEYLGNPAQYLVIRTWTEATAHAAYRQSAASKEFAASRPAHFIYDNQAVQEWQCQLETPGPASGDFIIRSLQTIDPADWQALISERGRHDAAALASGGVDSLRAFRMLANEKADDTQVLRLDRWAGRSSYVRYLGSSQLAAYQKDAIFGTARLTECYQVEDEVVAKA